MFSLDDIVVQIENKTRKPKATHDYATRIESQRPSSRKRFNHIFTKDGVAPLATAHPIRAKTRVKPTSKLCHE